MAGPEPAHLQAPPGLREQSSVALRRTLPAGCLRWFICAAAGVPCLIFAGVSPPPAPPPPLDLCTLKLLRMERGVQRSPPKTEGRYFVCGGKAVLGPPVGGWRLAVGGSTPGIDGPIDATPVVDASEAADGLSAGRVAAEWQLCVPAGVKECCQFGGTTRTVPAQVLSLPTAPGPLHGSSLSLASRAVRTCGLLPSQERMNSLKFQIATDYSVEDYLNHQAAQHNYMVCSRSGGGGGLVWAGGHQFLRPPAPA